MAEKSRSSAGSSPCRERPVRGARDRPELDEGYGAHAPIGAFAPNPFGLYEVHGNLYEWHLDGHGAGAVRPDTDVDPVTPPDGAALRFSAGGSFNSTAAQTRVTMRNFSTPERSASWLGVRPARGLEPGTP